VERRILWVVQNIFSSFLPSWLAPKGLSSPLQHIQSKPGHLKSRISLAKLMPVIQEYGMHEDTEVRTKMIEGKYCA
jgi:hypothetical protein